MKLIEEVKYEVFEMADGSFKVTGGMKSNSPTGWSNFENHSIENKDELQKYLIGKNKLLSTLANER